MTWSNTWRLLRMMSTWPLVIGSKEPGYTAIGFIRRPPSLLLLHLGAAAADRAGASLGHDHLHAALRANVDLSDLIRHARAVLLPAPKPWLAARSEGGDALASIRRGLQ